MRQRVQRLIDRGVMQVVAVTDPATLGFAVQAMVAVSVTGDVRKVADADGQARRGRVRRDHRRPLRPPRRGRLRRHGPPPRPGERPHARREGRHEHRGLHLPQPREADLQLGRPLDVTLRLFLPRLAARMIAMATSMTIVASTCTCGGSAMRAESNTRRGKVTVGPATNDVMM